MPIYHTKLYGADLVTDSPELYGIVTADYVGQRTAEQATAELAARFPGLSEKIVEIFRAMDAANRPRRLILYCNRRLQVWSGEDLDIEPSAVWSLRPVG